MNQAAQITDESRMNYSMISLKNDSKMRFATPGRGI
jgi:hypothetical protein